MKRVLFIANHKGFSKFNAPYMQWFKDQGWVVDNASPGIETGNVDNQYDIDIQRSPFSTKNLKALMQLEKIIRENHYNLIHCHTPMGAVLGRVAAILAKTRSKGCKVIYTVHGFHFFKGSPALNWIVYYPIELVLSKYTDTLVTLNQEDYNFALRHKMAHGNVYKINGVGCDLTRFRPLSALEKHNVRHSLSISDDAFVVLYTAQFIKRKNHTLLISQVPNLVKLIPNLVVLLVGNGPEFEKMKQYAHTLGVENSINFLGGRNDVNKLCGIADVHVSTSLQEGLAMSNIEAMACGCPLVVSNARGCRDVCIVGRNGFIFDLSAPESLVSGITELYNDKELYHAISQNNLMDAERYSVIESVNAMSKIYLKSLQESRPH